MSLLQQAIQLLSEPPGNVVYHLVTLLTLQAVFAVSRSHWQRDPTDQMAQRMTWAAGVIFLAEAAYLLAGTLLSSDLVSVELLLPPLEQAIHTLTAVLIVWALGRHSTRVPRLGDVLLQIVIFTIGVMTIYFVQQWRDPLLRDIAYSSSRQAKIWGLIQIGILGVGLPLTMRTRQLRRSLNPIIVGVLLLAHLVSLWNKPEILPTNTEIAYWVRLGYLIIFPLWAALAYRRSLQPLLIAGQANQPPAEQLRQSLQLSTEMIKASDPEEIICRAIEMVAKLVDAAFVGVALFEEQSRGQMRLYSLQMGSGPERLSTWALNLPDWPAFRLAVDQKQRVQLMPNGLGARQLHDWYTNIGVTPLGALIIQPPTVTQSTMGLLLLAGPEAYNEWSERDKTLAEVLADLMAQVLEKRGTPVRAIDQSLVLPGADGPEAVRANQLARLKNERSQQLADLESIRNRLQRAEERASSTEQRARDLAATIEELEQRNQDDLVTALQTEIASLRESLVEAEEAMAMAAAAEGSLSPEWVMRTITRYSGQLEEAQERIDSLETELGRWEQGPGNQVLASLTQELRTPMTSIAGYADLLLSERMGMMGLVQHDLLQRIRVNSEKMGTLVEQIVQMTTVRRQPDQQHKSKERVNVQEVVESAIGTIITQVREKHLRLDLDIEIDLPRLHIDRNSLAQIVSNLLDNACRSVTRNGRVSVAAHAYSVPSASSNGHVDEIDFLQLSVTDSGGGISDEDRRYVFDPQYRAENPLIAGLGDTGAGLTVARTLTEANGGRIWVESQMSVGSTFSALFPIAAPEPEIRATSNGE